MDKKTQLPQVSSILPDAQYAQIVSIAASKYDVTLAFFQVEQRRLGNEGNDFIPFQKEVARVIMPIEAAHELANVLGQVFSKTKEQRP